MGSQKSFHDFWLPMPFSSDEGRSHWAWRPEVFQVCAVLVLFAIAVVLVGGLTFAGFLALATLIPWLIVGLVAGALASLVTNSSTGIIGDILVGIAGAFIGGALFAALHVHPLIFGRLLEAIVGAIILLLIVKLMRGPTFY